MTQQLNITTVQSEAGGSAEAIEKAEPYHDEAEDIEVERVLFLDKGDVEVRIVEAIAERQILRNENRWQHVVDYAFGQRYAGLYVELIH